jgi:hypothetical protein
MNILKREQILTATDTPLIPVEIPEWNGIVYIRAMSLAALKSLTDRIKARGGDENAAFIAVNVALDQSGQRLFKDEDEAVLKERSIKALNRIVTAFNQANELTEARVDAAVGN